MTSFSKLSSTAQDLIIDALMGKFDESGPPEMSPEVRAELEAWSITDGTHDAFTHSHD